VKICLQQADEGFSTTFFSGLKPINKKPHLAKNADEVFRAKDLPAAGRRGFPNNFVFGNKTNK
jgi:hypothetical protein